MKTKNLLSLFFLLIGTFSLGAQNYSQSTDVMLQGFNWVSHSNSGGWYNVVGSKATELGTAQFDMIWLPPPSDAAAPQGYLPRELYDVNSEYGSEQELKNCISALHNNGMKVLADIVVNHRVGSTNWADFTNPSWGCWAVVSNDEWGQNGGNPCGNYDTGDNYHAARDIDHTNGTVQNDLTGWMNWLKSSIGFDGWRYDYVRGFNGYYNGLYNDGTSPYFSVGELWDNLDLNNVNGHRQQIVNWIDDTNGKSAAFDFTTKGVLQAAVNNEYWRLNINGGAPGVIGWWPSRAVTFVDNHDTGSTQNYWPFPGGKVMQGYAYILTHPGVPSVFWDHYFDWGLKTAINELIAVRKDNSLHSESTIDIKAAQWNLYAAVIDDKVAMKIGPGNWSPSGSGWTLRTSGADYAVWDKAVSNNDLTIHFKPTSWSNPKLYFWNATPSGATTGWPGVSMQWEGNGWYKYTLTGTDCSNFIVSNNGSPQSPDMYTCNEVWITQGNWNSSLQSGGTTGNQIEGGFGDLATLRLSAYPNPIRERATISVQQPTEGELELSVYSLNGQKISTLAEGIFPAGDQQFAVDASTWAPGIYLAKLRMGQTSQSLKLIVLP